MAARSAIRFGLAQVEASRVRRLAVGEPRAPHARQIAGHVSAAVAHIADCDDIAPTVGRRVELLRVGPRVADCDGVASNGCETNITLVTSCRACGVRCDLAAATSRCGAMGCEIVTCDRGFADCDHNAANGCEEYLEAPESCGVCGSRCAARPNTSARCDSMRCSYLCIAGWCDADGMAANGCETRC